MFSLLIVDDNVFDREGIKDLIDWRSLDVAIAGVAQNGLEGYKKAVELKPDIVLADVLMPLMDGIAMTEKIKKQLPKTRFIFMSCYDEFDYAKNAIDLDVSSYILKPIDLEELKTAIVKVKSLIECENEILLRQKKLKAKLQESLPVLQEQFIWDMIRGRDFDETAITERMNFLNIPFRKSFIIVLIQIDNYELNYGKLPAEERYLLVYNLKSCAEGSLLWQNQGYVLVENMSNLCAVIFGDWNDNGEAVNDLMERCDQCLERVNKTLKIRITLGVSNFSREIRDMPQMFEDAEFAVKSKFYGAGNRIILTSEIRQEDRVYNYNFGELKKDLNAILENGTRKDIFELLDKYCTAESGCSEIFVKSLYFSIINALQILLVERNTGLGEIFGNEAMIWEKLSKFETIVDIRQWLVSFLLGVKDYLDKKSTGRYQSIVSDIKAVIDRDYAKIQNVEQIVETLYISASHGNYIFKQETGKTIFEYLIMVRMERAKQLLEDPYCRIYEIAESVGYASKSYFGSVFKEYTGMTPKQYRDRFCKNGRGGGAE